MARPPHRSHGRTAQNTVTDASGYWRVHDGTGTTLVIDGTPLHNLTYDEARKAKDYAVTKHRKRQAGLKRQDGPVATATVGFAGEGNPSSPPPDAPRTDPQLEAARQKALAAARPAAAAAQDRHARHKAKAALDELSAGLPKTPIVGLDPIEGDDDSDLGFDESDVDDVEDILATGNKPKSDDAQRAKEQAEEDAKAAEAAGKALYEREHPTAHARWEHLMDRERANYRWRALNEVDVRVGDVVTFYEGHDEQGQLHPTLAQVVQVHDRDTVSLQTGVSLDPSTGDASPATGPVIPRVGRRGAAGPLPNTWELL